MTYNLSRRGSQTNEDFSFTTKTSAAVIDGASGLGAFNVTDWDSDAKWLSHLTGEKLMSQIDDGQPIKELLTKISSELLTSYRQKLNIKNQKMPASVLTPSSSMSIVRQLDQEIEIYQLGDSPIIYGSSENGWKLVADENLVKLDQTALKKITDYAQTHQVTVAEARNKLNEVLEKNRNLRNQNAGYYIYDLFSTGISHGKHLLVPKSEVSEIAIISDGLAAAYDTYGMINDLAEFMTVLKNQQATELLIKELRKLESKDETLTSFPRFKIHDDASVAYFNFSKN